MLTTVRLPVDWTTLGFAESFVVGGVAVASGPRSWAWSGDAPDVGIDLATAVDALPAPPSWGIDHVVLLVPDLDRAVDAVEAAGHAVRRRVEVRGRRTAFFLVGTLLEVVEEPTVDRSVLWGIALETADLATVADRWRARGHDVAGPRPAFQEGREIITVKDLGAGVAVMSRRDAKKGIV